MRKLGWSPAGQKIAFDTVFGSFEEVCPQYGKKKLFRAVHDVCCRVWCALGRRPFSRVIIKRLKRLDRCRPIYDTSDSWACHLLQFCPWCRYRAAVTVLNREIFPLDARVHCYLYTQTPESVARKTTRGIQERFRREGSKRITFRKWRINSENAPELITLIVAEKINKHADDVWAHKETTYRRALMAGLRFHHEQITGPLDQIQDLMLVADSRTALYRVALQSSI